MKVYISKWWRTSGLVVRTVRKPVLSEDERREFVRVTRKSNTLPVMMALGVDAFENKQDAEKDIEVRKTRRDIAQQNKKDAERQIENWLCGRPLATPRSQWLE